MTIKKLIVVYYPLGILITYALNIQEALFLFSITAFSTVMDFEFVDFIAFFAFLFVLSLPYGTIHDLVAATAISIPFVFFRKSFDLKNIKTLIPPTVVALFRFGQSIPAVILASLYYIVKGDYRYFIGCAIVLLAATAYILTISPEKFANEIATIAYYCLVLGTFGAILEFFRENKTDSNSKDETL